MNRFLVFTVLALAFVIGFGSIAVAIGPQISTPAEKTALIKEVP
jgi:phosphate/sulfate permease